MAIKKTFLIAAKLILVLALMVWMIQDGRLDLSSLKIFREKPAFLLISIGFWLLVPVSLGSLRWWLLMRGTNIKVALQRAFQLQMIGIFFNTTMPGAISGDLVKAVYVIREQDKVGRTPAALAILMDRVVGLMGLFSIAGFASLLFLNRFDANPILKPMAYLVFIFVLAMALFLAVVFFPHREGRDPLEWLLKCRPRFVGGVFSAVHKIYVALRAYRDNPWHLLGAWLCSVIIQGLGILFYWYTTNLLTGQAPFWPEFVIVLPFGMIATVLPIAPGGLGVGHVAFDKLYSLIGLSGGANVFNAIAIGQLLLNLTGVFPYIFMRRRGDRTTVTKNELNHAAY
jgi:glycosyltransferase 2 family protein